jgi:hypothetical protein
MGGHSKLSRGGCNNRRTSEQSATLEEKRESEGRSEGEGFIFIVFRLGLGYKNIINKMTLN